VSWFTLLKGQRGLSLSADKLPIFLFICGKFCA